MFHSFTCVSLATSLDALPALTRQVEPRYLSSEMASWQNRWFAAEVYTY